MLIKADMYAAGGEAATYVEDVIGRNTTKTYNVTTGIFWMQYNSYATSIAVKDGELIEKSATPYGTVDYSDGVVTFTDGNYSDQTIHGYYI